MRDRCRLPPVSVKNVWALSKGVGAQKSSGFGQDADPRTPPTALCLHAHCTTCKWGWPDPARISGAGDLEAALLCNSFSVGLGSFRSHAIMRSMLMLARLAHDRPSMQ